MGALLGVAGDHVLHQAAVGRAAGLRLAVVDPLHPARLVVVEEHVVPHVQLVVAQHQSPAAKCINFEFALNLRNIYKNS